MANVHWKVAVDGNFATADYWKGDQVPLSTDSVFLDAKGAAFTVTSSANQAVAGLTTIATATLAITSQSTFTIAQGKAITNAGTISVSGGATLSIAGSIDNSGTISVTGAGLNIGQDGEKFGGGGQITLNNGVVMGLGVFPPSRIENLNDTISGSGQIGYMDLVNYGTINANAATVLSIGTQMSLSNFGLIECTGLGGMTIRGVGLTNKRGGVITVAAGTLAIDLTLVDNNEGSINVAAGGRISLNDSGISGALSVAQGASLTVDSGSIASHGPNLIDTGKYEANITNAGLLAVNDTAQLLAGGTFHNTGVIQINSRGDATILSVHKSLTLMGAGQVNLTDSAQNQINAYGDSFTNVDNTISGSGQIGVGNMVLRNLAAGVIDANGFNAGLIIDTGLANRDINYGLIEETGDAGLTISDTTLRNRGTVQAAGTGLLLISGATVINSAGRVTVAADTHVSLKNSAITGGSLAVAAHGLLSVDSAYGDSIAALKFTNAGTLAVGALDGLTLAGPITNSGAIQLDSSGQTARLTIAAAGVVLSGGGKVQLTDNFNNSIIGVSGAATLVNVDNIISGSGNLGGDQLTLDNQKSGVIDASGTTVSLILQTGKTFGDTNEGLVETTGAGGLIITSTVMVNSGTVQAAGAGDLIVQGATIANAAAGLVTAKAGSHMSLKGGGVILDGTLTIAQGATLTSDSAYGDFITGAAFTNSGVTAIGNGDGLTVAGRVTNSGEIELNSAGSAAVFFVGSAGVVLSGAGSVVLSDKTSNLIRAYNGAANLTNVDNTISGAGRLGGYSLSLDNQAAGVIDATGEASALTLEFGTSLTATNEGLIETTQAGGLVIESTSLANSGRVEALGSGVLTIQTASVANSASGTVSAAGGAHISLKGGGGIGGGLLSIASGATLTADSAYSNFISVTTFDNAGSVVVGDGDGLTLEGAIANTGTISLNGTTHTATLQVGVAGLTLSGGGALTLSSDAQNTLIGETAASTLTNVDNHISGGGKLGDGLLTLVNEAGGVITGNAAVALTLDTGGNTIVNAGEILAAGGTVIVKSAIDNTGTVMAGAGGTLTLDGAVTGSGTDKCQGGTLDVVGAFNGDLAFGKTGQCELGDSQGGTCTVSGFSDTGKTSLDLQDIGFAQGTTQCVYVDNGHGTGGVLTVSDGAEHSVVDLVGDYVGTTFTASGDGHGGSTVVDNKSPGPRVPAFVAALARMGASEGTALIGPAPMALHPTSIVAPRTFA